MVLVTIITLVSAVLQIILFFKVWGMCNDVKRMASHFCGEEDPNAGIVEDYNARIAAGDKSIEKYARKRMLEDLKSITKKAQGLVEEDYERIHGSTPSKDIAAVKEKYQKIYSKLGVAFPAEIAKVKTIEDLWELFD